MKKVITLFFVCFLILVNINIVTINMFSAEGIEQPEEPSTGDSSEAAATTTRGARAHYEPSYFADYNTYYLNPDGRLSGMPKINDGTDPSVGRVVMPMGTSNSVEWNLFRGYSIPYELKKNVTFDKGRRPYVSLTLNSLNNADKLVQAKVLIDTDGDETYDAYLDFQPYLTTGDNQDGTQEEEIYEAEGIWQGGTSPGTIKGNIGIKVWQTNQQGEDLVLYCGFDYKISWLALPYNHKDLVPVADAGTPEPVEPIEFIHTGDMVVFNGNRSYDPNDDLNSNGTIEPNLGEHDNLRYKWDFGDGTETDFAAANKKVWHTYTKATIPKGFEYKRFDVHLWVQDPEGHVDDDWTSVTIFRGNHSPKIYSFKINDVEFMLKSSPHQITAVFYQEVRFEAKVVDFDEDELTYHWDIDEDGKFDKVGLQDIAGSFKHVYHPDYIDDNFIKITLMVSDGTPETENDTFCAFIKVVENLKPVPRIYARKEGDEDHYYNSIKVRLDQKITLYGTDSYDPDNLPALYYESSFPDFFADPYNELTYKWYFDHENDHSVNSGWLNTGEVECIYQVENPELKYIVALEVNDGLNTNISEKFTVIINLPPVPQATIIDGSYLHTGLLYTQSPIYFDASGSYDPNGDELEFIWDFGDRSAVSTEMNPEHIYATPGYFIVKLTLSDGDFVTEPLKLAVNIKEKPLPPKAVPTLSTLQTYTLTDIWFDAALSYDPDGYYYAPKDPSTFGKDLIKYRWDFGDGNYSSEINTTHAYAKKGVYQISLRVWDKTDIKAENKKFIIEILNRQPIAHPGPDRQSVAHENVIFSGEHSTDIDGVVASYLWDFGDGSEPAWVEALKTNHSYTQPGTYHVTLQVKDDDGTVSEAANIIVTIESQDERTNYGELVVLTIIIVIILIVVILTAIIYIRSRKGI